jgi:hypothetical protein
LDARERLIIYEIRDVFFVGRHHRPRNIFGVVFQNDLFVDFLREGAGLMIAVPLTLILGLIALGFWLEKIKVGKVISFSLVASVSSIVSLYCFGKTGALINNWKIHDVEAYVERAIPVLDRIKQKTDRTSRNSPSIFWANHQNFCGFMETTLPL